MPNLIKIKNILVDGRT